MYREALALAFRQLRPSAEVMLGPLESLDGEAKVFRPHMLVGNDSDGDVPGALANVMCRVEILFSDGLDARVSFDGGVRHIKDIGIENLLALADEAEKRIPDETIA